MIDVIITEQEKLTDAVVKLTLASREGADLPAFKAGAHIDVRVSDDIVRQYSICSSASVKNQYSVAVLKDPNSRGGSARIHEHFEAGQTIQISEPRNLFALTEDTAPVLLIGAGIGITPLLSMAHTLAERGQDFTLCYVHKPADQVAFKAELLVAPFAGRTVFIPAVSRPETREQLQSLIGSYRSGHNIYTCGPAAFMELVFEIASAQEWPKESLHREMFQNISMNEEKQDSAFTLYLAKSDRSVEVGAGQTALEALDEAGIDVDASCEQGVCGTCLLRVVAGKVDHRDAYLTEEEKLQHNQFTPCCSRALSSSLSIDL